MEREMRDRKSVAATTDLTVYVECPYCTAYQNRLMDLREHFDYNSLSAELCEVELKCDVCYEIFYVTSIEY